MKTRIKKGVCLLTAVLFCCLSAACQPTMNDPAITTTTTIANNDTVTTTTVQSSESTTVDDKTTTTSPSTTTMMTGSVPLSTTSTSTTRVTTTTTTPVVQSVKVYINDVLFSDFDPSITQYTYPLHPTVTVAPTVKLQNGGAVTQATSANGMASFALGGKTYRIQFEKKAQSSFLDNTYYKLKVEKKLNIGFIGGSVTYGAGASNAVEKRWSRLTTNWFKEQFPDATITETNVGINATDSQLGCYRIYNDLKLGDKEKHPDLIFVEFSINDYHNNVDSSVYMESLIRSVYAHNPDTDIYLVLISDWSLQGGESAKTKLHKSLARTYLLPYSHVGVQIWNKIVAENGSAKPTSDTDPAWTKYYYDYVHPNDAGYALMTQLITKDIGNIFAAKSSAPKQSIASYQPKAQVYEGYIPLLPHAETVQGQKGSSRGITITDEGYLQSNKPGSYFLFEFSGTGFGFWSLSSKESADLELVIDGKITKTISLQNDIAKNRVFHAIDGLENKKHTVKVTVKKGKGGTLLDLKGILVSGGKVQPITLL